MSVTFSGSDKKPPKHKHQPGRHQRLTHSGMKWECEVCWRFITWVQPAGREGFWRLG